MQLLFTHLTEEITQRKEQIFRKEQIYSNLSKKFWNFLQDAVEAVKATNGYKLDKHHFFTVNLFSDFEKYENISTEWEPPKEEPYVDQGNRKSFLLNENAHDQYAVVYNGGEKVNNFSNINKWAVDS